LNQEESIATNVWV